MIGTEQLITILLAFVGSAGFWSYITMREKNKREDEARHTDTLRQQVDRLAEKLDDKTDQIKELLGEIATLRADLATAQATIKHLEELLRHRPIGAKSE